MALLRGMAEWSAISGLLNLGWEFAQLPLYRIPGSGTPGETAFAVLHCTVGDVAISAITFLAAAVASHSQRWPFERPLSGGASAIATGISYTVFSEWLNVYVRESWTYAPSMPTLLGIGLAPFAQWIIVPVFALFLVRRITRKANDAS